MAKGGHEHCLAWQYITGPCWFFCFAYI